MKLFGRISGAEMVMMIESRTTDHFVSPATMEKLWNGAEVTHSKSFGVPLGNEEWVQGEWVRVEIRLRGYTASGYSSLEIG